MNVSPSAPTRPATKTDRPKSGKPKKVHTYHKPSADAAREMGIGEVRTHCGRWQRIPKYERMYSSNSGTIDYDYCLNCLRVLGVQP